MAVEIVDLPISNGDFPSYVTVLGALEHMDYFSVKLGFSSQLTHLILFRGVGAPPTSQIFEQIFQGWRSPNGPTFKVSEILQFTQNIYKMIIVKNKGYKTMMNYIYYPLINCDITMENHNF